MTSQTERTDQRMERRWLYVHRTIDAGTSDVEGQLSRLRELLQVGTGSDPSPSPENGSFLLTVPGPAFAAPLARQIRLQVGPRQDRTDRLVLPITWRASPAGAMFPAFEGAFEVERLDAGHWQIALLGVTGPANGAPTTAVDPAVLHTVALQTAGRLLRSLCGELDASVLAAPPAEANGALSLFVGDVMTPDPMVVLEDAPVRSAALLLHHGGVTGLPVVDRDGTLVGVVSETDLLPHIATQRRGERLRGSRERRRREADTAGEVCSRPARCTSPDTKVSTAARRMLDHDVGRLVVLEHDRIVGIVSRHDVLATLIRTDAGLQGAVGTLLREHGAGDVDTTISSGKVVLRGEVDARSTALRLPSLIGEIDGVDEVESTDLTWRVDDLIRLQPMPLT